MTHADPPRAGLPPTPGAGIRVVSIPHADPYVDAVLPAGAVRVGTGAEPSPWLDAGYLAAHVDEVDVVHLHAGYGHLEASALEAWAEQLQRLGVPLVVTVHGLREEPHAPPGRHQALLAAALATAEVVFTLTPGAADEIAEAYGRTAIVVAHPSVAAADPELGAERGLVGVRLGAASEAVPDPLLLVRAALSGAVSGGGRLRVLVEDVAAPGLDPGVVALAEEGAVELTPYRAGEWSAQLQQLHAAVLPERCGTHSRDVEICRDVGTRVVAPGCGWFADQWSEVVPYAHDERGGLDPVSLTAAIGAALTRPMPRPADRVWREGQRAAVRDVHGEVYAQVAADRSRV
ncbi:glycosyltransferase [Blastococcus xanthinilyticus]|uniref:Glycosyl transferase family 4 n=1 Tax=Blastococcus xanthinilyticus TaxID=1564164 RepID=A0A5S5CVP3_9ACTN|nr:glycosyltransferase [Blastococcus xanthinilyticus]TYP87871.1 glycosyl transferase family 4 [Blastococcus xanthinilyticus]